MPQKQINRIEAERDLYFHLLNLDSQNTVESILEKTLKLIAKFTNAEKCYIELLEQKNADGKPPILAEYFCNVSDTENTQSYNTVSVKNTPFYKRPDKKQPDNNDSIISSPIGKKCPIGILHLYKSAEKGTFSEEDKKLCQLFSKQLATAYTEKLQSPYKHKKENDCIEQHRKKLTVPNIIGRSSALAEVFHQVSLVAPLDICVLLTGDSGTGKSLLAQAIHENSARSKKPFLEINCAAIPEGLIESELFGALPGAHSTASKKITGKIAAADGGTLFLDEIGEMHISSQTKLLQFLQSKTYYPLGGTKPEKANIRIIAATNINMLEAVKEGKFREDLFYRLNVMPIHLPSINERKEDIVPLAEFFALKFCTDNNLPSIKLSLDTHNFLESSHWPGNVRQLQNSIQAGVIRANAEKSGYVEPNHIFSCGAGKTFESQTLTFQDATREFQCRLLKKTLKNNNGNITQAASDLALTRTHVYNLIKTFEIAKADYN